MLNKQKYIQSAFMTDYSAVKLCMDYSIIYILGLIQGGELHLIFRIISSGFSCTSYFSNNLSRPSFYFCPSLHPSLLMYWVCSPQYPTWWLDIKYESSKSYIGILPSPYNILVCLLTFYFSNTGSEHRDQKLCWSIVEFYDYSNTQ